MLNLKHIEAFVTVADLGSFRRAAERLNTTQPNISNRIAQLEAQLGVTVMERDAGSVRLTPKGKALLGPARGVLAALNTFVAAADDDTLFRDTLRLGVSEMVAHTWLRAFLIEMKARFPNITVELTVDLSANLSKALFDRDLDLVFQNGPFDRKTRSALPLGQSPYVWIAAPDMDLPAGPLSAQEISRHPILTHARGSVPFRQLEDHFRPLGPVRLVPSSNMSACLQMALDRLGIACLPCAMVTPHLANGTLRVLNYPWRPDALQFHARHDADPAPRFVTEAALIAQRLFPPEDMKS
ncbi:MAG: LysR family transcriptional regulator [Cypionkella sp.]